MLLHMLVVARQQVQQQLDLILQTQDAAQTLEIAAARHNAVPKAAAGVSAAGSSSELPETALAVCRHKCFSTDYKLLAVLTAGAVTLRIVLMMNLSSADRKKTLPDLPGDGSSRRAWSPAGEQLRASRCRYIDPGIDVNELRKCRCTGHLQQLDCKSCSPQRMAAVQLPAVLCQVCLACMLPHRRPTACSRLHQC